MGNQPGKLQNNNQSGRRKKMVHWKSAEWPHPPGRPILISLPDQLPDVVSLHWERPKFDGGSPIIGYYVEHRRMGSPHWVRSTPTSVNVCEVSISGLEPGWRYQFRVFAENVVGRSNPSELSDPLTVTLQRNAISVPRFVDELRDTNAVEDERVEFRVRVLGHPPPEISWLKDGYEIFSSRRTKIVTDNDTSVLIIHQVALTDEGEIRCTATNRAGHVVTKSNLYVQAPPKIRLPRAYEDGLIVEADEVLRLKVGIAGQPAPKITWLYEGREILNEGRFEITNTERNSMLKIDSVKRDDRGEYGIRIVNNLGEDAASFLVTVTARPNPPGKVQLKMSFGRSATLCWTAPLDDGGCKIGSYIVEYFRVGWNVWLKAATTRSLTATLNDLIEGSEYKFRVKAENPYGVSDPSPESNILFIPDAKRGIIKPKSERYLAEETKEKKAVKSTPARSKTLSPSRPQKDAATDMTRVHFSPDMSRKHQPKIIEHTQLDREMSYGASNKAIMNELGKPPTKPPTIQFTALMNAPSPRVSRKISPAATDRKTSLSLPKMLSPIRQDSHKNKEVSTSQPKESPRRSLSPFPAQPVAALQRSSEPVVEPDIKTKSSLEILLERLNNSNEKQEETNSKSPNQPAPEVVKEQSPPVEPKESKSNVLFSSSNQPNMASLSEKHDEIHTSNEFMLVVFDKKCSVNDKNKQDSFELDLEDAIQPPSISISSPDLGSLVFTNLQTFPLRRSVSSTELLYERAMARFYEAVELEEAEKSRKLELEQEKRNATLNLQTVNTPIYRKRLGSMTETERLSFERRRMLRRQPSDGSTNLKTGFRWNSQEHLEKFKPTTSSNDSKLQRQQSKNTEEDSELQDDSLHGYRLQHQAESTDLGSDYTESTASSEEDSIEKFKIQLMERTRSTSPLELETYHPRDMSAGVFTPYRSPEPEQAAVVLNRPLPLPDPDFVPKPILKRTSNEREDVQEKKNKEDPTEGKIDQMAKGLKSFFKRDKSNVNSAEKTTTESEAAETAELATQVKSNAPKVASAAEIEVKRKAKEEEEKKRKEAERVMHEEALAAVDLYSDIVSSVSKTRNYRTPLYADKEKLQKFAEARTQSEEDGNFQAADLTAQTPILNNNKPRLSISEREQLTHVRQTPSELAVTELNSRKNSLEVKEKRTIKVKRIVKKRVPSRSRTRESGSLVVLEQPPMNAELVGSVENLAESVTTTVVEQVSEKEAHEKVHSALSYSTDLVLFLVACYVYLFKEAKLVLPILALMIYRQLGEAIQSWTPKWLRRQKQ